MRALTGPKEGGATLSRSAYETNSTLDISEFSDNFSDISDKPFPMLTLMNENQPKEPETLANAARRLLETLDARKRPAVETTARIAVLCRIPSTANREAGTLTIVAMEYSTKRQGAAFIPFGWEEEVAERESEDGHLASFPARS